MNGITTYEKNHFDCTVYLKIAQMPPRYLIYSLFQINQVDEVAKFY